MTMIARLRFRDFTIEDHAALLDLWRTAELSHRPRGRDSLEAMAAEVQRPYSHLLLAELEGQMVGSVLASHDGRRGWINRLAVHPEWRGQGLASELIDRAEAWLMEQGLKILVCLIEEENTPSRRLFQKKDYVEHRDIVYYSKRLQPDV